MCFILFNCNFGVMFDYKGFRRAFSLTQAQLANILMCGQPNISAMEKTMKNLEVEHEKILIEKYGEDSVRKFSVSQILDDNPSKSNMEKGETEEKPAAPPKDNYRLVPIIHIDSVGGMHSHNSIVQEPQYIEGYAPFAGAKEGDVCIIQSGDSMIPTCPAGSLLLVRQVLDWREYFGYGNIFVLVLTDGRRITKEVTKYTPDPQNYVWCVSHNPDVPDEELPKSMIAAVWKVIKILVNKGW